MQLLVVTAYFEGNKGQAIVGGYESDSGDAFFAGEVLGLSLEAADDLLAGRMSDKQANAISDVLGN